MTSAIAEPRIGSGKRETVEMLVTPAMAEDWLKQNHGNRPLGMRAVRSIAERMRQGKWAVTHQGLALDSNGRLLDGQHRLTAIVESNIPHRYVVTFGADPETFKNVDCGGRGARKSSDLLEFLCPDLKNKTTCAAVGNRALRGRSDSRFDRDQVAEFVTDNRTIIEPIVEVLRNSPAATAALMGAFVAFARSRRDTSYPGPKGGYDLKEVLAHAKRYASQNWTGDGDPLKALFTRILREKGQREKRGTEVTDAKVYDLTVAALRNAMAGTEVRGRLVGTDIDVGDEREVVPLNSSAYKEKRSLASEKGHRTLVRRRNDKN